MMRTVAVLTFLALIAMVVSHDASTADQSSHSHEEFTALQSKLAEFEESTTKKITESHQISENKLNELSQAQSSLKQAVGSLQTQVSDSQNKVLSAEKEIQEYFERLAAISRAVEAQTEVNKRLSSDIQNAVTSVSAVSSRVRENGDDAAKAAASAAEADKKMSNLENEVATLKQLVEQVTKLSSQLNSDITQVSAKMDLQYNATLLLIKDISGQSNVTDFAKFIDRVSNWISGFYHDHIEPTAGKLWDFTKVYTEQAVTFLREHSVVVREQGPVHFEQGRAQLKQKLGEAGVPVEHVDLAVYAILGVAGLLLLSIVFVSCRCCCGSSRKSVSAASIVTHTNTSTAGPRAPVNRKPTKTA